MLGAAGVQIPEDNLDDLHSLRKEDGTSKIMDPQDLLGCDLLALVDGFTPVEDNIGSVNLTLLSLFFGITATNFPSVLLILGQIVDQLREDIPIETDKMKLVVEIKCFGVSFDEFDKETGSFDELQPKQGVEWFHALRTSFA
ncbi:hypothetical protein Tco_0189000 [Tanacetum coccineum]